MNRVGNFTSSQVYRLMSKGRGSLSVDNCGKPYETYITEKLRELRTGRSISSMATSRSCEWGNFMEGWMFENKLGLDYALVSKTRFEHPSLPWSGMPDLIKDNLIGDIKNPYTINSFCDLADSITDKTIKETHPEYYWQLVSNAILCNVDNAELIVHVPYLDELAEIREATELYDGDQNKVAFINWASDDELPYLIREQYYKDIYKLEFKVSEKDKEMLTERITMAANELKKINN